MIVAIFAVVCYVPMIIEAVVAGRHDRRLRIGGAIEPTADVYRWMQFAYPGAFALMLVEGGVRGRTADATFVAGCALFGVAKILKYWAVATLGPRWSFRVLVPPGSTRIVSGPYRWMRHPNYVAVVGELVAVAIAMHASVTAVPAVGGFGALIWKRISVEEKALLQE